MGCSCFSKTKAIKINSFNIGSVNKDNSMKLLLNKGNSNSICNNSNVIDYINPKITKIKNLVKEINNDGNGKNRNNLTLLENTPLIEYDIKNRIFELNFKSRGNKHEEIQIINKTMIKKIDTNCFSGMESGTDVKLSEKFNTDYRTYCTFNKLSSFHLTSSESNVMFNKQINKRLKNAHSLRMDRIKNINHNLLNELKERSKINEAKNMKKKGIVKGIIKKRKEDILEKKCDSPYIMNKINLNIVKNMKFRLLFKKENNRKDLLERKANFIQKEKYKKVNFKKLISEELWYEVLDYLDYNTLQIVGTCTSFMLRFFKNPYILVKFYNNKSEFLNSDENKDIENFENIETNDYDAISIMNIDEDIDEETARSEFQSDGYEGLRNVMNMNKTKIGINESKRSSIISNHNHKSSFKIKRLYSNTKSLNNKRSKLKLKKPAKIKSSKSFKLSYMSRKNGILKDSIFNHKMKTSHLQYSSNTTILKSMRKIKLTENLDKFKNRNTLNKISVKNQSNQYLKVKISTQKLSSPTSGIMRVFNFHASSKSNIDLRSSSDNNIKSDHVNIMPNRLSTSSSNISKSCNLFLNDVSFNDNTSAKLKSSLQFIDNSDTKNEDSFDSFILYEL